MISKGSVPLENIIKDHTVQFHECVFSSLRKKKSGDRIEIYILTSGI